jgi:hypothetical protein
MTKRSADELPEGEPVAKRAVCGPLELERDDALSFFHFADPLMLLKHLYPLLGTQDRVAFSRTCVHVYNAVGEWRATTRTIQWKHMHLQRHQGLYVAKLFANAVALWNFDEWPGLNMLQIIVNRDCLDNVDEVRFEVQFPVLDVHPNNRMRLCFMINRYGSARAYGKVPLPLTKAPIDCFGTIYDIDSIIASMREICAKRIMYDTS